MRTILWQTLVPLYLFIVCILGPGCTCDLPAALVVNRYGICKSNHAPFAVAPPLTAKNVVPGHAVVEMGVDAVGGLEVTIPLVDDDLHISYDGENEGSVGYGFRIDGAWSSSVAIKRRSSTANKAKFDSMTAITRPCASTPNPLPLGENRPRFRGCQYENSGAALGQGQLFVCRSHGRRIAGLCRIQHPLR